MTTQVDVQRPLAKRLSLQAAHAEGYPSVSTLRRYISDGRLPAVRFGGRIEIRRSDLEALAVPIQPATTPVDAAIHRLASSLPDLTDQQTKRLALILARTPTSASPSVGVQ